MVKVEKAFEMARHIMRKEGIFVGMSSGAAMCAALEIAQSMTSGNVVVIFSDGGEEHLSTELFHS
jgi:cysteine synthase B